MLKDGLKYLLFVIDYLSSLELKTLNKLELIPVDWFEDGDIGYDFDDTVVNHHRIVAKLENDSIKKSGSDLANHIIDQFPNNDVAGGLSLRIWNSISRYGRHWIQNFE